MSSNVNSEKLYISVCKELIEKKLSGIIQQPLRRKDLLYLIDEIYEHTKILLSLSTLKRIWQCSYMGEPQSKTLDAFSLYLGYKNWLDFKKNCAEEYTGKSGKDLKVTLHEKDVPVRMDNNKLFLINNTKRTFVYINRVAIFIIVILSSLVLLRSSSMGIEQEILTNHIQFSVEKILSQGMPTTVLFKYDIPGKINDNFYLKPYKNAKQKQIDPLKKQITSFYPYAGIYHPKIVLNDKEVKDTKLLLNTSGWQTLLIPKNRKEFPVYLEDKEIISNGRIHVSPEVLRKNQFTLYENVEKIEYVNVQDFGDLLSDCFILKTRIKNSLNEGAVICQSSLIIIMCEEGNYQIAFSHPGYVGYLNLKFGNKVIKGKTNDLSYLGCDMNQWQNIEMNVKNKKIELYRNSVLLQNYIINESLGRIIGIKIKFSGCGSVDYVQFYNHSSELIYSEDFNHSSYFR